MKTMYRISLFENSNNLAETLAILAAKSNGSESKHSLADLKNVAEGQKILYPSTNENTTCELIGDNILHLDRKVGENYETVLRIEQVEVMEVPTLSYQNGLANPDHEHILN